MNRTRRGSEATEARCHQRARDGFRSGFTLLEMMIALGILAVAYVALMNAQSASIRLSTFGKQITVATFLAQSKLEETEEQLTREGFPDMDDEEQGDFEELGYPSFGWRLQVNKVELPLDDAFGQLFDRFSGSGEEGEGGVAGGAGGLQEMLGGQLSEQLKGQLGSMLGSGGARAGAGLMNPDMIKGQMDMLAKTLEQALREVRLVVYWDGGGPGNELALTTHLVQVPQATATQGAGVPGMHGPGGSGSPADRLKAAIDRRIPPSPKPSTPKPKR